MIVTYVSREVCFGRNFLGHEVHRNCGLGHAAGCRRREKADRDGDNDDDEEEEDEDEDEDDALLP